MSFFEKNKKILMLGGGVFGAILLYKMIASKNENTGINYEHQPHNNVVYQPNGVVFNAQSVANELYLQMEESNVDSWASAELLDTIKSRIPNGRMQEVISAFGLRRYYVYQSPSDLKYWLKKELNTSHYNIVKSLYSEVNWI